MYIFSCLTGPSAETPEQNIDYDFAQQELMMEQMGNDPIQEAITAIEKQHEDDKAGKRLMSNGKDEICLWPVANVSAVAKTLASHKD